LQFTKQDFPKNSTEAGTMILFREEQQENAQFPIRRRRESGSTEKLDNPEQKKKQKSPITSIVFGK
jgi:hypothetical protein